MESDRAELNPLSDCRLGKKKERTEGGKNEEQEQNPIRKYASGSLFTDKQAVLDKRGWCKGGGRGKRGVGGPYRDLNSGSAFFRHFNLDKSVRFSNCR